MVNPIRPLVALIAILSTGAFAATKDGTADIVSTLQGCTAIPDNTYRGDPFAAGQAVCETFSTGTGTINSLQLDLGIDHTWVGDLVIKVRNPAGTKTVTLVSRAGVLEADDTGTSTGNGNNANLAATSPLRYKDSFTPSAETEGTGLASADVICVAAGSPCDYRPNAGATAQPGTLATFDGDAAGPGWTLCVGDRANLDTGSLCSINVVNGGGGGGLAYTVPTSSAAAPIAVGSAAVGSAVSTNVAVTAAAANAGPLSIASCTPLTAPFSYGTTPPSFPIVIAAGATANIPVRFAPTAAGTATANFTCTTNGTPATFQVFVSAQGASVFVPTPSMNGYGLALMALMLVGFSAYAMRKR